LLHPPYINDNIYIIKDKKLKAYNFKATLLWESAYNMLQSSHFDQIQMLTEKTLPYIALYDKGNKKLSIINKENGELEWNTEGISTSIFLNDKIILTGRKKTLVALDILDGQEIWKYNLNAEIRKIYPVSSDLILVETQNNKLHAFKILNGKRLWTFKMNSYITTPNILIGDSNVYFGNRDTYVYALNKNNGKLVWKYKMEFWSINSLKIVNKTIIAADEGKILYAINALSGKEEWTFKGYETFPEIGNNSYVFFSDVNGKLFALDSL